MKAIIQIDVPDHQIGQEVSIYFKDTMMIKGVVKEQSGDLISRQAVLERLKKEDKILYTTTGLNYLIRAIGELPSVKPQEPKEGHWVMPVQDDGMSDPIYYQVRCSECGFDLDPQTWHQELHQYDADKFCPSCGCRMVEPQESGDKCKNCEYYRNPDYTRCHECKAESEVQDADSN